MFCSSGIKLLFILTDLTTAFIYSRAHPGNRNDSVFLSHNGGRSQNNAMV